MVFWDQTEREKAPHLRCCWVLSALPGGEIDVFGKRFNSKNRMKILKNIGSLIETPSYYGHLTGKENLEIIQTILKVPKSNIDKVLKIVRLESQAEKRSGRIHWE